MDRLQVYRKGYVPDCVEFVFESNEEHVVAAQYVRWIPVLLSRYKCGSYYKVEGMLMMAGGKDMYRNTPPCHV